MTIPKKNNLRKIKVDNIEYYWRFGHDYKKRKLNVIIGEVSKPNKRIILSAKYVDAWLANNIEEFIANEIQIVKPQLIKRTIKFAKENGWYLQEKIKTFKVNLENNFLNLIE